MRPFGSKVLRAPYSVHVGEACVLCTAMAGADAGASPSQINAFRRLVQRVDNLDQRVNGLSGSSGATVDSLDQQISSLVQVANRLEQRVAQQQQSNEETQQLLVSHQQNQQLLHNNIEQLQQQVQQLLQLVQQQQQQIQQLQQGAATGAATAAAVAPAPAPVPISVPAALFQYSATLRGVPSADFAFLSARGMPTAADDAFCCQGPAKILIHEP